MCRISYAINICFCYDIFYQNISIVWLLVPKYSQLHSLAIVCVMQFSLCNRQSFPFGNVVFYVHMLPYIYYRHVAFSPSHSRKIFVRLQFTLGNFLPFGTCTILSLKSICFLSTRVRNIFLRLLFAFKQEGLHFFFILSHFFSIQQFA